MKVLPGPEQQKADGEEDDDKKGLLVRAVSTSDDANNRSKSASTSSSSSSSSCSISMGNAASTGRPTSTWVAISTVSKAGRAGEAGGVSLLLSGSTDCPVSSSIRPIASI